MPERAQQPALAPAPARASTARPRRQRSRKPLPEGVLSYKILPGKGETNPVRQWLREQWQSALVIGVMLLALAILLPCVWAGWSIAQCLGPLAYAWFIPLPVDQYTHLQEEVRSKHFFLAGPMIIWCAVLLVQALGAVSDAWARFKKRHHRQRQVRRAPKEPQPQPGAWPRSAVVAFSTAACALLALPMLRDYDIVTADAIVHQGSLTWSPRVYPISELRCVHVARPYKGGPSWQLAFGPHGQLHVQSINTATLNRLMARQHLRASPTPCQ